MLLSGNSESVLVFDFSVKQRGGASEKQSREEGGELLL
jgi:hypothetical protein